LHSQTPTGSSDNKNQRGKERRMRGGRDKSTRRTAGGSEKGSSKTGKEKKNVIIRGSAHWKKGGKTNGKMKNVSGSLRFNVAS